MWMENLNVVQGFITLRPERFRGAVCWPTVAMDVLLITSKYFSNLLQYCYNIVI
jgi:hypothetical protein